MISAIIGKDLVLKQETSPPKRQLWVRGGKGQSCDSVCKAKGEQCNEDAFTKQTDATQNTQSMTLRKTAFMVRTILSVLSVHPPVITHPPRTIVSKRTTPSPSSADTHTHTHTQTNKHAHTQHHTHAHAQHHAGRGLVRFRRIQFMLGHRAHHRQKKRRHAKSVLVR